MKILAFIICIMFSSSLFADTYALCEGSEEISLKFARNKVFINENNKGLVDWSKFIEKYTKEEVVINKSIKHNKIFKCSDLDEDSQKYNYLDCGIFPNQIEKRINDVYKKNPFSEKIIFKIDRISGLMSKEHLRYRLEFFEYGSSIMPRMADYFNLKRDYKCEATDKTLF